MSKVECTQESPSDQGGVPSEVTPVSRELIKTASNNVANLCSRKQASTRSHVPTGICLKASDSELAARGAGQTEKQVQAKEGQLVSERPAAGRVAPVTVCSSALLGTTTPGDTHTRRRPAVQSS